MIGLKGVEPLAPTEKPDEPPKAIKADRDNGDRRFFEVWETVWAFREEVAKRFGRIESKWSRLDGQMAVITVMILGLFVAIAGLYLT